MNENKFLNISINIKDNTLFLEKEEKRDIRFPAKVPFETGFDESKPNNLRIELGISMVFHKVLNLLKSDAPLFEKQDYELLGEMLAKILFGKKTDDNNNHRNQIMIEAERMVDQKNNAGKLGCRIFLDFDYDSKVAMLPWEYTRYQLRDTLPNIIESLYLGADKLSGFQLIRRFKKNPVPPPDSRQLLVIVIANFEGNKNAKPIINIRSEEFINIKSSLMSLQNLPKTDPDNYPYPIEFHFLINPHVGEIIPQIQNQYQIWESKYGHEPAYIIHYIGHAMFEDEIGYIVVKNSETGLAEWREDKKFAALFHKDKLKIRQPSILCLQACDSAKIGRDKNDLRGVAYEFCKLNIPAVIGMQNEIDEPSSSAFFMQFYKSLLMVNDVAQAVTDGRDYLGKDYNVEDQSYVTNSFGSPVLFISTDEPVQILEPEFETGADKQTNTKIDKVDPKQFSEASNNQTNENKSARPNKPDKDKLIEPLKHNDPTRTI